MYDLAYRNIRRHILNIVEHYRAYFKVSYNTPQGDVYVERLKEFPEFIPQIDNVTFRIFLDRYQDEPTFENTLLFLSTKIGRQIFDPLFSRELIDDILADNRSIEPTGNVSFEQRYGE